MTCAPMMGAPFYAPSKAELKAQKKAAKFAEKDAVKSHMAYNKQAKKSMKASRKGAYPAYPVAAPMYSGYGVDPCFAPPMCGVVDPCFAPPMCGAPMAYPMAPVPKKAGLFSKGQNKHIIPGIDIPFVPYV